MQSPALLTTLGLMRGSPLPMLLWWGQARQPHANDAYLALLGRQALPLHEAAWGEAWPGVQADLLKVQGTGEVVWRENLPLPLPHVAHGEFCGTYSYNPVLDAQGVAGVLFMCTRHYRASSVRADGRFGYAAVIHSMDVGFAIVEALDTPPGQLLDYRYIEINEAWTQQTGMGQVQGKRITELVNEREPFWPRTIEHVIQTGHSVRAVTDTKFMNRIMDVFAMRLGGPGSRQVALLVQDVTTQTRNREALQRSEQRARAEAERAEAERTRLDAVLEATPAPVFVVDAQGCFIRANSRARQEWGHHLQAESHAWMGWWADGSARDGQRLAADDWPLHRALRGDTCQAIIEIARPQDARQRRIHLVSGAPILGPQQAVEGAVITATDITERMQAERVLQEEHQRKDEFLAMLAHELRNPLAPIGAAAELMAQPQAGKDLMLRTSDIIARQVRHITGLVDDLLDMSRVNRGTITLDTQWLDSGSVLRDAVEQITPLLQARGHQLDVQPPPTPLRFKGDHKRVVQVLSNLLSNAIKYTPKGGHIWLAMSHAAGWLELHVRDNGLGMDPGMLARAFDLFAQARRSSDRQQGGLGIGLALVKKLVELHGGSVQASSPGLGQGSEFLVRLPCCEPLPDTPPPPPQAARDKAPQLRVLVVDDHVDGALTLSMLIESEGHACQVAHDPTWALTLANREAPDALVLDIGLPGMDGRELARRLRAQPATAGALLIGLSGYAQPQDRQAALDAGFDHYLTKPVDSAQLLALLAQAVPAERLARA